MSDSSDDEKEGDYVKSKASRGLKMKKWLGSKTASSKVGRKAVSYFLGSDGEHLMDSLCDAGGRDRGEKAGKQLKQNIIKLALKSKILYDAQKLNERTTMHLVEPTNYMVLNLVDCLESKEDHTDVSVLVHLAKRIKKGIVSLLRAHINDKNLLILTDVFDWIGTEAFLEHLINDPAYAKEKRDMFTYASAIAAPLLDARDPDGACITATCNKLALKPSETGVFTGSSYCATHHKVLYQQVLKAPKIQHWISEEGKDCKGFITLMNTHSPKNYLAFYRGSSNFLRSERNKRNVFATLVWEKYFADDAAQPLPGINADIVADIKKHIVAIKGDPEADPVVAPTDAPLKLFDKVRRVVLESLNSVFENKFVKSEEYKAYCVSMKPSA